MTTSLAFTQYISVTGNFLNYIVVQQQVRNRDAYLHLYKVIYKVKNVVGGIWTDGIITQICRSRKLNYILSTSMQNSITPLLLSILVENFKPSTNCHGRTW